MMGMSVTEAGHRVVTERTRAIMAAYEARRIASEYHEAATGYFATPSATNYIRLIKAMDAHQRAKYGQ